MDLHIIRGNGKRKKLHLSDGGGGDKVGDMTEKETGIINSTAVGKLHGRMAGPILIFKGLERGDDDTGKMGGKGKQIPTWGKHPKGKINVGLIPH